MPVQLLTQEEYQDLKNHKEAFCALIDTILIGENENSEFTLLYYMKALISFARTIKDTKP